MPETSGKYCIGQFEHEMEATSLRGNSRPSTVVEPADVLLSLSTTRGATGREERTAEVKRSEANGADAQLFRSRVERRVQYRAVDECQRS
jgi:hypothetical protein